MTYLHTTHDTDQDHSLMHLMGGLMVDDLAHARHVMELTSQLFWLTWPLHGFGAHEEQLIRRAALLHDSGILVSYRGHHKESLQLIMETDFPDLTDEEQRIVACIARYHRKALPRRSHTVYGDLPRIQRQKVDELGGILRLADAFDYHHDGGVISLAGYVISTPGKASQVLIHAIHRIEARDQLRDVMTKAEEKRTLFEQAFGCRVSIMPTTPREQLTLFPRHVSPRPTHTHRRSENTSTELS